MKIIEVINEESFTKPKYSQSRTTVLELSDDLIEKIRRDCKETLKNDQYFFRGMGTPYNANVLYGDSEIGTRLSANTENYYTLLIDEVLPEWKYYPKRSKSFICASTERTAASYGNTFYVLPVGTPYIVICPQDDIWHSFDAFNYLPDLNKAFKECKVGQDTPSIKKFIEGMNDDFDHFRELLENDITTYRETIRESLLGRFFSASSDIMYKHTLPLVLREYDSFMDWLEVTLTPQDFRLLKSNDYKEQYRSHEIWFSGKAYFVTEEALFKIKNKKITESVSSDNDNPQKFANAIKDFCKPFLSQVQKGSYLYRGDSTAKGDFVIKEVRQDRTPRDTSKDIHNLFNHLIQQGGYKANRSNSLFTFGDIDNVKTFLDDGSNKNIFVCFPIGQFNYLWHRLYKDWTVDVMHDLSELYGAKTVDIKHFIMYRTTESLFFNSEYIEKIKAYIVQFIREVREMGVANTVLDVFERETLGIKTINDVRSAIRSVDVFLNAIGEDDYQTVKETYERLLKNLLDSTRKFVFDDFVEYLEGDNGTLQTAIENGHEVMIHCQKVIMVRLDYFKKEVEKYL